MGSDADQAFRRAIGAFATGVAVISAARPGLGVCGITVNSLTSVSLKPRLLLWCLGDQSDRYAHFAEADAWGLTILGAGEEAVARRFTKSEAETIAAEEAETFAGAAILKGVGVAQFACRTFDRRVAGDHLVITGEVQDFRVSSGGVLTYLRGRFGGADDPGSA